MCMLKQSGNDIWQYNDIERLYTIIFIYMIIFDIMIYDNVFIEGERTYIMLILIIIVTYFDL